MFTERVTDVAAWLYQHAGLHDVILSAITIDAAAAAVSFAVDDLDTDNEGTPGHVDRPCRLVFGGVTRFGIDADLTEQVLWIADATLTDATLEIYIAGRAGPYGHHYPTIRLSFATLDVVDAG